MSDVNRVDVGGYDRHGNWARFDRLLALGRGTEFYHFGIKSGRVSGLVSSAQVLPFAGRGNFKFHLGGIEVGGASS